MSLSSIYSPKINDEEEFADILEDLRRSWDLGHALRTFKPSVPDTGPPPCSAAELTAAVRTSQHLRYLTQGGVCVGVCVCVEVILSEMSQNLQMSSIRLLGYGLNKAMKRLFHARQRQHGRLQPTAQGYPVILMPNHRSYMDFLIISFLSFTYDLPIPVIAAGTPLSKMKLMGEIFRRCGAFYIRRGIGSDKLYWAFCPSMVKTIVRRAYAPLEFYVEGLRSRTLKALPPKLGMMHMVLEPFFKGEVYDITLVPISISYDRVVEESLLAHELLGVPKPRETTRGLLKASSVLWENYGSMHVNIGQALSVRAMCQGKIDRNHYNRVPRDLPQKPGEDMQACVSLLAHRVVRDQEQGAVLSPWSLMATVLLQSPVPSLVQEGLPWGALAQRTLWLRGHALAFGARLNWPDTCTESDEVMSSNMSLHHSVARRRGGRVFLLEEEGFAGRRPTSAEEGVAWRAVAVLMMASHRNQALHVFARPAMLAVAIVSIKPSDDLIMFSLVNVFHSTACGASWEINVCRSRVYQDFEEACSLLGKAGAIQCCQEEISVTDAGQQTMTFLKTLLQPFMDSYQVTCRHIVPIDWLTDWSMTAFYRLLFLNSELQTYEALSSDTQSNALSSLLRLEAVTKLRT
uniref:Glyceronephosphate O-acyltransferase 2 n=1 Tax=Gadus morhua TaxID=8049 RepID=A0A8C5CY21_GADMO